MDLDRRDGADDAHKCQSDPRNVYQNCPGDVLPNDTAGPAGDAEGFDKTCKVVAEENDVGALASDCGTGTHCYADMCGGERRSVVDAVANHGNQPTLRHELPHPGDLGLRKHIGLHLANTELASDGLADSGVVAGQK